MGNHSVISKRKLAILEALIQVKRNAKWSCCDGKWIILNDGQIPRVMTPGEQRHFAEVIPMQVSEQLVQQKQPGLSADERQYLVVSLFVPGMRTVRLKPRK